MTTFSRRQFISVLISAFFWAVIVTLFLLVPVRSAVEEPVYREIKIQLAPLSEPEKVPEPVVEKLPVVEQAAIADVVPELLTQPAPSASEVKAPAQQPEPAPKAAEASRALPEPAPKAAEQAQKTAEPPKQAAPAKTPTPAPEPAKQKLVKSVDQLMAEQNASKGTKKTADDVDWDALFGNSSSASSSVSTGEKTFAAQTGSALSGSAAASASDSGTAAAASSGKATDSQASASTASALSDIAGAKGSGTSGGSSGSAAGVSGGTGTAQGGSADGSGLEWNSGAGRKLLRPATTEIQFTEEQKALITASIRNIRISFTVQPDGTVQRSSIVIDRKASLPAAISQEIEWQISDWHFETGTSDGQAVFVYSIIKE